MPPFTKEGGIIHFHRWSLPGAGRDDKSIIGNLFVKVKICSGRQREREYELLP